jgi:hypothetical protein
MIKITGMIRDAGVVFNHRMGKPEEQTTGNPHFRKDRLPRFKWAKIK